LEKGWYRAYRWRTGGAAGPLFQRHSRKNKLEERPDYFPGREKGRVRSKNDARDLWTRTYSTINLDKSEARRYSIRQEGGGDGHENERGVVVREVRALLLP